MSTTTHPSYDRRFSSPPCAHLPHTPIAPAMDPDFLALKRKIAKTNHSFTERWFGPDDIVESLDWDEAIGDGYRRYSYNSQTDTIVVVVPTALHRAVETWLRNEVERMHSTGFLETSEVEELRLLFGNVIDKFPLPYHQSRKQPAGAIIPYAKDHEDDYDEENGNDYTTEECSPTYENEHRKPTLVVEVGEIGITATQIKKDMVMWGVSGVEIAFLLLVEWHGVHDGEYEEEEIEREVKSVDVEVYNLMKENGTEKMMLVKRMRLIQPGKHRDSISSEWEKVNITRRQLLGERCAMDPEKVFEMELGGLKQLLQLATPHAGFTPGNKGG